MAADDSILKRCSTCRVEKPTDCFSKKARMKDGLASQCRSCVAEWWQRYYAERREEQRERSKVYRKTRPRPDPAIHREYWARNREAIAVRRKAKYESDERLREVNRRRAAAWALEHREEQQRKGREYYAANRDERKRKVREYEAANPEKVRWWSRIKTNQRRARLSGAGGKYTEEDVQRLYRLQKGRCANCRGSLKSGYHVDHRIPVARGGSNDPTNIELLCPNCNMRKSSKLPHEFAKEEGRLL